jgi:branched-chain amino acid transport system substrate-binding protein
MKLVTRSLALGLAVSGALGLGTVPGTAGAEDLKIGMITTLSGGGSGLGIDVRDGFLLAL